MITKEEIDRENNPEEYAQRDADMEADLEAYTYHGIEKPLEKKYAKMISVMKMGKSSKPCSICLILFKVDEVIYKLPCKHIFHKGCLDGWLKKQSSCPLCRLDIKEYFDTHEKQELQSTSDLYFSQAFQHKNPYL